MPKKLFGRKKDYSHCFDMPAEILNIEYHTRRLLLIALNKYKFKSRAFAALGVSEKQGYNLIKLHEVKRGDKGYYSDKKIEFKKDIAS